MARINNLGNFLTDVANAIRGKKGTESAISAENFDTEISSIVELKGETKTITPTTSSQTITPSSGKNGITEVTVNAVTSSIDNNIISSNIKSGVSILGVNGSVVELNGETKTVKSTTSQQTVTPSQNKNGITEITVEPITLQNKTITPTSSQQTVTADNNYDGLDTVTINAVPQPNLQSKTVEILDNDEFYVTPDANYDGLSSVTIDVHVPITGNALVNTTLTDSYSKIPNNILSLPDDLDLSGLTNATETFRGLSRITEMPWFDTSNVTNMKDMFKYCSALVTLPNTPCYDTSSVQNMSGMFSYCSALTEIPLFNTDNVKDMSSMFSECSVLTTVPVLHTLSVTTMTNMFFRCYNLSNTSLDNILQMCINAIAYNGTKKLTQIGIYTGTYPAATIQALPHYSEFVNAGWSIN